MAISIETETYNVLVLGETGTGKSSVINLIFDEERAVTSDKIIGCTTDWKLYQGRPKGYENKHLSLYDTVGICESVEGTVPTVEALEKLKELFRSFNHRRGINILLFCVKMGRLTQTAKTNYRLFVNEMCDNRVPCILVITRCEQEDELGSWWNEYQDVIKQQLEYNICQGISVTARKTGRQFSQMNYDKSRRNLIEAINKCALRRSWNPNGRIRNYFLFLRSLCKVRNSKDVFQQYVEAPMDELEDEEDERKKEVPTVSSREIQDL